MAQVIDDTHHFIATRDYANRIKVFFFLNGDMFACRPTNVVREGGHIYFQDENKDQTWVVKNHKGFYQAPEDKINEFYQVMLRENLQQIPWEDL